MVRLTWVFVISKQDRLRRPSILFAFATIFNISGPQFRSLDARKPRSFLILHDDNSFPRTRYGKLIGFRFLVTVSTLHFSVLKFILDFMHPFSSIVKSSCIDWQLCTGSLSTVCGRRLSGFQWS